MKDEEERLAELFERKLREIEENGRCEISSDEILACTDSPVDSLEVGSVTIVDSGAALSFADNLDELPRELQKLQ